VAAVDHLEKGDLGVTREVNVLGAVGDELHKTTTRHFCISLAEKKILDSETGAARRGAARRGAARRGGQTPRV
jgi:hypothetical protein